MAMCQTHALLLHSAQFLFLHLLQAPSMSKHSYIRVQDRKHIEGHHQKCLKMRTAFQFSSTIVKDEIFQSNCFGVILFPVFIS